MGREQCLKRWCLRISKIDKKHQADIWENFKPQQEKHKEPRHIMVKFLKIKDKERTSLVAQWLRIRLPMQGTWVWALVREDPTCRRATKPVCHNYRACALEPTGHNCWACEPQLLKPTCPRAHALQLLKPVLHNKRSHCSEWLCSHTATKSSPHLLQPEKARTQQWRPSAAKNFLKS